MLFDHLVVSQVVKGPKFVVKKGKPPVLTAAEGRGSNGRKNIRPVLTGLESCPVEASFRFFHEPVSGVDVVKSQIRKHDVMGPFLGYHVVQEFTLGR